MTARELAEMVGKAGTYSVNSLKIDVVVLDAKQVYGRVDFLIEPKAGSGRIWVASSSVKPLAHKV